MKSLDLKDLTIEQKLGQLIVARNISAPDDFEFAMELIRNHALGGVQVNPDTETFNKCAKPVLAAADYPIFIAADMEKGYQMGSLHIPGNLALGALASPEYAYQFAKITAKQAKKAGYNMIWSPVVDSADHNCANAIPRCMSSDNELIARLAIRYAQAFADCGVISAAKHYPSGDDSEMDSHMAPTVSYRTKERLMDGSPYLAMLRALGDDMTGIMVGHTVYKEIDPDRPATLSKKCIDMIREAGFDGLAITDSFAMMGILRDFGDDKVLGLAVAAGNDLLLPNYRIPLRQSYNYLVENFKAGLFSEERLNEAVTRVIRAQERTLYRPAESELAITDGDIETVERINRDCVCARADAGLPPSIERGKRHLFAIDMPNAYLTEDGAGVNEISSLPWWNPKKIAERLKADFPNSEIQFFCEFPSRLEVENVCFKSTRADDVVFVTFCDCLCYQGTDGLTERARIMIKAVQSRIAAVVHFGNPYAMEEIVHVPRLIFGFPSDLCIESALDVLAGLTAPKGIMPIALKLI